MARRLAFLLVVPLLMVGLAACGAATTGGLPDLPDLPGDPPGTEPPPSPVPPPPTGGTSMSAEELQMALEVLDLVNAERQQAGLPALDWADDAAEVAYQHSVDMDVRGFFDHVNPDGQEPWDRMDEAGMTYRAAGENIAYGYSTPAAVMAGWMGSDGHRENILRTSFTRVGIGVHRGGTTYWTQVFYAP